MPQALLYADQRSLAAYLGGVAMLQPELGQASCRALRLEPSAAKLPELALLFADDLRLPPPAESAAGTLLLPAEYDLDAHLLTLTRGGERLALSVDPRRSQDDPRELARVLRPLPWSRPPTHPELVYMCPPGPTLARLVTEHLELGRDQLRYAPVRGETLGEQVLLQVDEPSWFVLERWVPGKGEVRAFRRLQGTLGARRVLLEWGVEHPLEASLTDPAGEDNLLLIGQDGEHYLIKLGQFRDVGDVLDLDPARYGAEALVEADEPERIPVGLRLEGRPQPLDPELWLLPASQRQRLEQLLTQTPEEELRNLLVAQVSQPDGQRLFAVRELLAGRARPRLLPLGHRAYAPMPGLPNLLLPCEQGLAPPLSNDRYARSFALRPGELTILDQPEAEGALRVLRLEERAFQPIERIVDFVIDAESERLEQVVLATPFDLGAFAEEDLVPAQVARQREASKPEPEPQAEDDRVDEPALPRPKPREQSLLGRIKNLFGGEEDEAAPAQAGDPLRERIDQLERELVLDADPPPARWWQLSRALQTEGQPDESLRAAENALWSLEGEPGEEVWTELARALGRSAPGPAQDTLSLYQHVFAYRERVGALSGAEQADRYREATEQIYEELREHEGRLRKKSRWLLWSRVLQETGHAIEEERQREDILSELVLRGIEEREVPPFVRRVLLDHYGLRAATGSGATEVLSFLDGALNFAGSFGHPAFRAEALSHVAWAFAQLGEPQRALAAAKQAEQQAAETSGATAHWAFRARCQARVGAVYERVQGRDQGRGRLEQALTTISRLLQNASPNTQEDTDGNKALAAWFEALADARGAGTRLDDDPLLEQGLAELTSRRPEKQVHVLASYGAAQAIQRLGGSTWGREHARQLLFDPELKLESLEDLVSVLEVFSDGQAVRTEDAERIVAALLTHASLISEFSIDMLLVALRGHPSPPWEVIERLCGELERQGLVYQARLVTIAGLRCLAERRDRQQGPRRLAETLKAAWGHEGGRAGLHMSSEPPGTERMRLVVRLGALVPAFGMREQGLQLLNGIKEQAKEERQVFLRNELLYSTALAASKLGDSRSSFELIEEVAQEAIDSFEGSDGGFSQARWLLFETLEQCASGAAELGDTRRGLELIGRIADAARGALRRSSGAQDVGRYFYCRCLIACGHAALGLGDGDRAQAIFQETFQRLQELRGQDLIDMLEVAADTASKLDGGQRYALARQVLEAARDQGDGAAISDLFERSAVELTRRIAQDMVQGESAFASALKRWKGREERAIRDRVALERVTVR